MANMIHKDNPFVISGYTSDNEAHSFITGHIISIIQDALVFITNAFFLCRRVAQAADAERLKTNY